MESSKAGRLANWLQIGANLGILAGLILVGFQIAQSNRIAAAQLFGENVESNISSYLALIGETPEQSMVRVLYEPQRATTQDYFVADQVYRVIFRQLTRAVLLSQANLYGTTDAVNPQSFGRLNFALFACPYGLAWLDQMLVALPPENSLHDALTLMRQEAGRRPAAATLEDRRTRVVDHLARLRGS